MEKCFVLLLWQEKLFRHIHIAYQSKLLYPRKIIKQIKATQKNLSQRYIFHSVAKDPDSNKGVKMQRKFLFLGFYNHLPYT